MRVKPDVKHIKISDFPRTPWPVSFGVRTALQRAFNYCRQYPDKMESLKATVVFIMQRIGEWEAAAKSVEFEGGSNKKPLQSATFVTPALTTTPSGELQQFNQPQVNHSDAIERSKEAPQLSAHVPNEGALVTPFEHVQMPTGTNPLKTPPKMPEQQEVMLQTERTESTPVVGGAYTPTLAERLAQVTGQQ